MDLPCPQDLSLLETAMGYTFKDKALLKQALTHKTFAYESASHDAKDNQRFEFLGDSVLGLVTAEWLHNQYPDFSEGEMTRRRALLVNRNNLAARARDIELSKYFFLGKGEEKTGGRDNSSNLASALEAVIAAVYFDGGLEKAAEFIISRIIRQS